MSLPKQIQAELDAAARIESELAAPPQAQEQPAPATEVNTPPVQPAAEPPAPAAPVASAEPVQDAEYWRRRFETMQGKYNAEVPRLHQDLRAMHGNYYRCNDYPGISAVQHHPGVLRHVHSDPVVVEAEREVLHRDRVRGDRQYQLGRRHQGHGGQGRHQPDPRPDDLDLPAGPRPVLPGAHPQHDRAADRQGQVLRLPHQRFARYAGAAEADGRLLQRRVHADEDRDRLERDLQHVHRCGYRQQRRDRRREVGLVQPRHGRFPVPARLRAAPRPSRS
jgi:hypothetical protein